jgi:hypothetical protein
MSDKERELILVTGQSGINVKECLKRLNKQSENERKIVSIEDKIAMNNEMSFGEFISSSTQYLQYEEWKKSFEGIYNEYLNPDLNVNLNEHIFLTFHATYYHQQKRELFTPVNFRLLEKLRGRVKMLMVFIDDIYDIYKRLMDEGQMFAKVLEKEPIDAAFYSVFNMNTLINWRQMEISLSRTLSDFLNTKLFIVATKHPTFMINRLVENPLNTLKIFYLSHPISVVRKESEEVIPDFVGQLKIEINKKLDDTDSVLFYPTTIDELIIKKVQKKGIDYYLPKLKPRWSLLYPADKLLSPPIPNRLEKINPLNPKEYEIDSESNEIKVFSKALSFLFKICKNQVISRDYTLVEQAHSGIVVIRPYLKGGISEGMIGEIKYNCELMKENQNKRECFIFSCEEDDKERKINRFFIELSNALKDPPEDSLDNLGKIWIAEGLDISKMDVKEIDNKIEGVVPRTFEFLPIGEKSNMWDGEKGSMKASVDARKERLGNILKLVNKDEIDDLLDKYQDIKNRIHYIKNYK